MLHSSDAPSARLARVALFVVVLTAGACRGPDAFYRGPSVITCKVSRQECAAYRVSTKSCVSPTEGEIDVIGDICYDPATDNRELATICEERYCSPGLDVPGSCHITEATSASGTLLCSPSSTSGGRVVRWTTHHQQCVMTDANGICTLAPVDEPHRECVTNFVAPLETVKAPPKEWISKMLHIDPIDFQIACPAPMFATRFQFAGPMGTASGGGTTANVTAVRGQASVTQFCDADGCFPNALGAFDADLADTTVSGTKLTNMSVSLTQPAPLTGMVDSGGHFFIGVAPNALELKVLGRKGTVDSFYGVRNATAWRLDTTSTTFRLRGSLAITDVAANGSALPITVTADVTATPATAATIACADASSIAKVFGFETPMSWSSASSQGTLSLVTSPIMQGCAALGLRGQGFMPIDSAPFSTRGLTTNAAASVDLYIPSSQPNPFWQGQLQMYLSCPSGNFFHQFIGQVELTGKPQKRFSTMRIPLTTAARNVLARPLDDCSIQYALNVNGTNQTWVFDNFRFAP